MAQLQRDTIMHVYGECHCGRIAFEAEVDPSRSAICNCTDCQKFTGSAFSVVVALPKDALSVQGKVSTFSKPGDSGQPLQRCFCPECGSPVVEEAA